MSLLENVFLQGVIERLGWMLVHFLWQATAVALLLTVSLRLLRRASANLRYIVSCATLVLMIVLPVVTMQLVEVSGPVAEAGLPPVVLSPAAAAPSPVTVEMADEIPAFVDAVPLETADLAAHVSWQEKLMAGLESALPYVVLGWLIGVFGLSTRHLGGWAQLQRLKRRMIREADPHLQGKLRQLAVHLGVRQAIRLLESAIVEVPTVVGWLRPVILLPASALTGLSMEQLEAILAHELAHIRRYDYLVNILQTVVEILGFYHPAVWWVSCRIRIERENCCDDMAVRLCGNSLQYACALTSLEETRHSRGDLAVAATGGGLMARIARLLGRPAVDDRRFAWLPGLVALLLVAGLIIPAAMVLAAQEQPPNDPPATEAAAPSSMVEGPAAQMTPEAPPQDDTPKQDEATVFIDVVIAKALTGATLDRETALLIDAVLAAENPQIANEIADPKTGATLGDILKRRVAGKSLAPATAEALVAVLQSRGYVETQAKPSVLTRNNIEAQIRTITEEYVHASPDPAVPPQRIELGTAVRVTPHLPRPAGGYVTLEIAVEWVDWASQMQPGGPPVVRTTEIASTVTARNDRYFSLLAEQDNGPDTEGEAPESILIMVKPRLVQSASESATRTQQAEQPRRQVLVEVRTIALEAGQFPTLGIEWSANSTNTLTGGMWSANSTNAPTAGLQIGYTPDRTFTDALLTALGTLQEQNRAKILSSQQVVALDGSQSRIRAITQEWLSQAGLPKIDSGTVLSVTPRVDDRDQITLEVEIQTSHALPRRQGSDLPIVTRRAATSTVTLRDGGTAAFAGLTPSPAAEGSQSAREIAIFVTARLIAEDRLSVTPSSGGTGTRGQLDNEAQPSSSRAWTIMQLSNCPPLLSGLGPRLAKLLEPSQQGNLAWQPVIDDGQLIVRIDMDEPNHAEVAVGLFEDAKWSKAPVAVRRVTGAGTHTLTGLPAGRFQIGAIAGKYAHALGVHHQWPQAVEIKPGRTTRVEVLVSKAFRAAAGLRYQGIMWDYLGNWDWQDDNALLRGRVTGPDGEPVPFALVQVREYQAVREGGIAAPNLGTNEDGIYKFGGMKWPYTLGALWYEPLPTAFGSRYQFRFLNRVSEGPQQVDFRFDKFPQGTAGVAGRVVDQSGAPVPGFFLRIQTMDFTTAVRQDRRRNPDGRTYTEYGYTLPFLSEDGGFEARGLPEGPVTVSAVALDNRRYETDRGKKIVLETSEIASVQLELARVKFVYGRVLFDDGSPAVAKPSPWEGAKTTIRMYWAPVPGGHAYHHAGDVDEEGYFCFYLKDAELDGLRSGERRLDIRVPLREPGRYQTVGQFPLDRLSEDKGEAGVVTVKHPLPQSLTPPSDSAENEGTIAATFEGVELRQALRRLSSMAGVPILTDPNVTGRIYATMQDVRLERALEIVLAGTPYLFKKGPDHYRVAASKKRINEQ